MSIALVQSTGNAAIGFGTSFTQAFVSNNTQGNALVAAGFTAGTSGGQTVTDSQNNTGWTLVRQQNADFNSYQISVFVLFNCKAGANTVSLNLNTAENSGNLFCIAEISGVNAVDQPNGQSNASNEGSAYTTPSITTQIANEIVIAAYQSGGNPTPTITSPMATLGAAAGGSSYGVAGYAIESLTRTYSGSIGGLSSGLIGSVILSLYNSSSTGGGSGMNGSGLLRLLGVD